VMVELRTRKREMIRDRGNRHQKLGLREFRVRVNLPSPIWQVRVPIRLVITPKWGLPNQIRHIVHLISHIRSYPPYRSQLHPPSVFLVHNCTILAEYKVMSSFSIFPCHDHELTLCTAYTEYSIHWIQHPPKIACLSFILMITRWL